jgi:hypothetical protein
MATALQQPKLLKSIHGVALLLELGKPSPDFGKVLNFISQDPLAARLKDPNTGNTAFHLILKSRMNSDVVQTVLKRLIEVSPLGLQVICYIPSFIS